MARSRWKMLYFSNSVWKKIFFIKRRYFRRYYKTIYERSSNIPKCFKFLYIKIHKGFVFRKLWSMPYLEGHKFGEFTWNRKLALYKAKQLKKKKKNNFEI